MKQFFGGVGGCSYSMSCMWGKHSTTELQPQCLKIIIFILKLKFLFSRLQQVKTMRMRKAAWTAVLEWQHCCQFWKEFRLRTIPVTANKWNNSPKSLAENQHSQITQLELYKDNTTWKTIVTRQWILYADFPNWEGKMTGILNEVDFGDTLWHQGCCNEF